MRKTMGVLAVGLAVGFIGAGCSSSDSSSGGGGTGDSPDFTALAGQFNAPSGTLAEGSAGAAVNGYGEASKASSVPVMAMSDATAAGELVPQSVDPLGSGLLSTCSQKAQDEFQKKAREAQSSNSNSAQINVTVNGCDCGGGGTASMSIFVSAQKQSNGQASGTMVYKAELNKCSSDGSTVSGKLFYSIAFAADANQSKAYFNGAMLYVIDLSVEGKNAGRYQAQFAVKGGKVFYLVKVSDGNVSVATEPGWNGATKTGTITVVAKNGTWTCKLEGGKGTCTSDTGSSFEVKG